MAVHVDELTGAARDASSRVAPGRDEYPPAPVDLSNSISERHPGMDAPDWLPEAWWGTACAVPPLGAVCLHEATCFGGAIRDFEGSRHWSGQLLLARGDRLVPDSFLVRSGVATLPGDVIRTEPPDGGLHLVDGLEPPEARAGLHYLVGAAHGHFGHFLLESLARLWFIPHLHDEDVRFVVYEPTLVDWQLRLLEGLGIAAERIVRVTKPMRFERLIVPSPAYDLHQWCAPAQAMVWRRLRTAFASREPTPPRVYLSRSRVKRRRRLLGEPALEDLFSRRGFAVVHPQELSVDEQVALAAGAELLAGTTGSAMYLGAFQRPGARRLIVAPRRFVYRDDQLISHAVGTSLAYLLSDDERPDAERLSRYPHPGAKARFTDFALDLEQAAPAIDAWIAGTYG